METRCYTCPHFSGTNHNFNTHAKSILTEQMRHIDIEKEKNKEKLKQRKTSGY